jgi:non-ribosomal peptide synthetase component F
LFEDQVAQAPQAVAVESDGQVLSYGELNARANRLAHHLLALGVRPDDRIAICSERSIGMVVSLLAVLKAGGAYVPVGPGLPDERIAFVLDDAAPVAVLAQGSLVQRLAGLATVPVLDEAQAATLTDPSTDDPDPQALGLSSDHLAYVMYTSGSTGTPKGVMVEHRQLCHQVTALRLRYGLSARDRVLQFAAFTFDMSVEEIFGALCSGAALILRTDAWLQDFWALAGSHAITLANLPTQFWHQLVLDGGLIPECLR